MKKTRCAPKAPGRWMHLALRLTILAYLLSFGFSLSALPQVQGKTVRGTVKNETDEPVMGVSITVKGTQVTTTSDAKGEFTVQIPDNSSILIFSFVGMKTQEVSASVGNNLTIVMAAEAQSLQEVVAIGYGVAKKKDLTGSISTIDGGSLSQKNMTQVSQALQGTMPGVMVMRSNSEPGASASIRIRGITTIGESDPLIIVDGVPVSSIDDINADDIQDISVLKDAASASIYGARAASGVILVTTKRPKLGQFSFEYDGSFGVDKATRFPEVVGARRYLEMINEFTWNDAGNTPGGEYALYSQDDVEHWLDYNKTDPNAYPVTNWVDLLVNDYAPRQSHFFGFSAGSDKIKSRASINYDKIDGLYDYKTYDRIMARVNNRIDINKFLTANIDLSFSQAISKSPSLNPIWDARRFAPIYAATWADGRIAEGKNGSNAYAGLLYGGFDNTWRNKFNGRISLEFHPIKSLSITGVLAPYLFSTKGKEFVKRIPYYSADDPTQFEGYIAGYSSTNLYEDRNDGKTFAKQLLANYHKKFNSHNLNLLAGYEDFYSFTENLGAQSENYTLSNFPYLDLGPLDYMRNSGNAWETAYRSYFGRLMYDFDNKYFLQANIRYDGSSRFHPDYRWGAFPSVSAGWTISEEPFLKGNRLFSFLKVRGSWGQLGNERIGNYPYQSSINYYNALFYQGNQVVSDITAAQVAYAIQDITWEITETVDFGVDAYFMNNRLMFTGDIYQKKTKGMLLELEIPDYMGFENPQQNAGRMNTKGWDVQLAWRDRINRDFKYSVNLNLSDATSTMGNLGGIVLDGSKIIRQGSQYNEWFGYVSNGLFQNQKDVDDAAKLYNSVKPGDVRYVDISGPDGVPDGKITPDYDRVLLGGSLPRYLYGGVINLEYKGFDFSMVFQGVGKQRSRLTEEMVKPFFSAWTNAPAIIDGNYWSAYNSDEQNLKARYPRLSYTGAENNNYEMSDYWLINGSYFRMKNIVLGYTLPERLTNRLRMQQIRFHLSATDLFSVDHFPKGWDPEVSYNSYISKTFIAGLSLKF